MNSDFQKLSAEERAQLLTALLLGELPPAEADALRAALAANPELAREHARLQQTIALVRETSAMDRKTSADGTPLRLDDKRREKLLATFKTPAPQATAPRRRRNLQFLPLALAAALVGLLIVSVMLPSLARSKSRAQRVTALPALGQSLADFDSDRYDAVPDRLSARVRAARPADQRENEVAFAENFTLSAHDSVAGKVETIAPAPKRPVIALAMPAANDTDGDGSAPMFGRRQISGQIQMLSDFSGEQLIAEGLREDSKRSGVARDLTRADDYGYALAAGDSIGLKPSAANPVPARGLSSQLSAPPITTTSGRQITTPVPTVNYAITDLERSSSVPPASGPTALANNLNLGETKMLGSIVAGMAPASPPPVATPAPPAGSGSSDRTFRSANMANLYADVALVPESEVEQKARFDSGGLAGGGGSVTIQDEGLFLANEFSTPSPQAGLAPKASMTPAEAQGIIEARRLQLRASGPASPRILPPTALGLEIKSAEPVQAATKSYAEETRSRESNSKQLLTEVEQAWSEPTAPTTPLADGFFKLDQSPRGTENKGVTARGGLVGGGAVGGLPVEAFSFGGSQNRSGGGGGGRGGGGNKGPGAGFGSGGGATYAGVSIAPGGSQGRSAGIDSLSDGIAVTPSAPVSAPVGLGKVTEFDTDAGMLVPNPVNQPAQFGFELAANPTPALDGMVDALEAIRKTPSNAGGASASKRGDSQNNFFRSRMLLEPSRSGRVSAARNPAPEPVQAAVRFADDGAVVSMNGITVVLTNALVSNDSWGVNENRSAAEQGAYWFGNTAQDNVQWDFIAPISDGEKTAPSEGRFKTIGDSTALNYQWRTADAGVAKDQPAGGVDGRLNVSGTGLGRRMNSVVTRAEKAVVSDPVANASPMTHEFLGDNFAVVPTSERGRAAGDVNGRVTVQLPALAGEPQLSRQSSPTRPAGGRQSELALEGGDAVVAEPAPPNVAMTGISTLSGGTVARLEMKEQAAPAEETKRPAVSGTHIVIANSGSVLPITNGAAAATFANMLVTDLATPGSLPVVSPPGATFNQLGFGEMSEELSQRQSVRDKLKRNIDATELELKTPKQGSVDILELAEADSPAKPSLWGRVAGAFSSEVQRGARISVEQDMPDVDPNARGFIKGSMPTPDPFFTQTELERIQSKPVLGKVVEKLKLDEEWAKKSGKKLSQDEAVALLKKKLDVRQDAKTTLIDIRAKSESAEEAARLANAVAQAYAETRKERHQELVGKGVVALREQLAEKDKQVAEAKQQLEQRLKERVSDREETNRPKPSAASPTPQPEVLTRDNAFSTFSLNVSDVSFKLAAASLEKGAMPDVATVRSEEFINAFDYRDPMPAAGVPLAFVSERARYPFAHNRDVLRFSVKTAAQGRDGGKPLNIVLLLDNSGSMERADRVRIIQEALRALAAQLQPQDKLSVVTFSRTARLWADGVTGAQAAEVAGKIAALTPEGGTNIEEALDLAYRTALRHYSATAMNRVVLLSDGAGNLGDVEPKSLKAKVESFRKQGVALDCFGIGWDGLNDDLLEQLSRNGDGRYGFVNTPEEASTEFAAQLAGALQVAASDVKVQVEFNPKRVTAYRQIGYAKHQLTKQQFRDNTVDAAEISASEAGNALYIIETNPRGEGPIATVRARFRVPQTSDYREHEWVVPFGSAVELEQSGSALRLATSASAFSEWLAGSPFAGEVTTDRLLGLLSGVPEVYGADPRPKKLEWMIRQAKSISGK